MMKKKALSCLSALSVSRLLAPRGPGAPGAVWGDHSRLLSDELLDQLLGA